MPPPAPFWSMIVRSKRDLLTLRQKARQIAHLLHFAPLEEACVAAGAFAVGLAARASFREIEIGFLLDAQHLSVVPRPPAGETRSLLKLSKPLPEAACDYSAENLGFLLARINERVPNDRFAEICKQNEEILQMLHRLQKTTTSAA